MMIRWQCTFVVLILFTNLLQFGNGTQQIVSHSTNEVSCDLPCADKIADRIFEHVTERYAALELRIVEKIELQVVKIERIIEERITRIETLLTEQISSFAGSANEYKEISKEIYKVEQNSTQLDHVVVNEPENVTTSEPTTSTPKSTEKSPENPDLLGTTPKDDLDDCIDGEPSDLDEDYSHQFIEARHGSSDRKRCSEIARSTTQSSIAAVTSEVSVSTTSSTIKSDSEDEAEKSVGTNEKTSIEDIDEESTAVSSKIHSTTEKSKIDKLPSLDQTVVLPEYTENVEVESVTNPSIEKEVSKVTTESTSEIVFESQELDQQAILPVFPDLDTTVTKKYEQELLKPTVNPKKIHPWIRPSTQKPKIALPDERTKVVQNMTSTTTQGTISYKIHFPTESCEDTVTTPSPKVAPKPPLVFRYSRNFLNGSWTIIHSRFNGMISFNRSWTEYRAPFGLIPGEYWAGLEAIHQLTKSGDYELLVLLKGFDGSVKTAMYDSFWVGSEATNYRLALGPFVGGDAGDSLSGASGQMFSTFDRDNDRSLCASCGQIFHSGWWFKDCGDANLNGPYTSAVDKEERPYGVSMNWWSFGRDYQGLQEAAMMVRKRARKLF